MSEQLKSKQHYVSQFYLKYWCDGEHLYRSRNNAAPRSTKTKEIAHKNKMYKLQKLTTDEINFFKAIYVSVEFPDFIKPILSKMISTFEMIHTAHNVINAVTELDGEFDLTKHKRQLEQEQTNILENYLGSIEGAGKTLLDKLTPDTCLAYFDEEKFDELLFYTALQMYRTYKINEAFKKGDLRKDMPDLKFDIKGENIYAIFAILITAKSIDAIVKQGYYMELLINQSELNIITSDQPVINIAEDPSKDLVFYFPLGPKKALKIYTMTQQFPPRIDISYVSNAEQIRHLNDAINDQKRTDLYALKEEDLSVYVK